MGIDDRDSRRDSGELAPTERMRQSPLTAAQNASRDDTTLPIIDATRYTVNHEVARGGLGRILAAHDRRLRRSIALKQALPERPDAGPLLLQEALTTARLQHPGIVPVYDAGYFTDGSPFYAMKLIEGRTLTSCISRCVTLSDRLALLPNVIAVADAIAYAHSQGVVHRDVKPANVLVGAFGETQVVDWGIACAAATPEPAREDGRRGVARGTLSGVIVGTPAYMAPEQARGEPVDERVDVYALGAMLYHLLTGAPPYDHKDSKDAASLLAELRARPPVPLGRRDEGIPVELVTIVEKAMARDRDARYASAARLADDLKRFQTGQLVSAHRYTLGALLGRWLRRHRITVAVAAVLLGVLATTSALSVSHIIDGRRREAARAEQLTVEYARSLVRRDPTATIAWLERLRLTEANLGTAWVLALAARSYGLSTEVWRGHRAPIADLGVSPDGRLAATAGLDWDVRLRDLETGQDRVLEGHRGLVVAVAWSPDGATLASASEDGSARLWTRSGASVASFAGHGAAVAAIAFVPDGHAVATIGYDGALRLWDLQAHELRAFRAGERHLDVLAVSPTGAELAAGGADGRVWLWRADGTRALVLGDASWGPVSDLAFSPDGTRLAGAHEGRGVQVWEVARGTLAGERERPGGATRVGWSGTGGALVSAGARGEVERWDPSTHETTAYPSLGDPVTDLRLADDPDWLVVATEHQLALWSAATATWTLLRGHEGPVARVAFVPGGRVLSAGADGSLRLWSASPAVHGSPRDASAAVILAFSPDGTQLASGHASGRVRVSTLDPEVERLRLEAGVGIADLAYTPDGKQLVLASDHHLLVVQLADGAERRLEGPESEIIDLEISADGRLVVSASMDGSIWIWDLATGKGRALPAHGGATQVAIAPDGRSLASASFDGSVRLWDVATGAAREVGRHQGHVYALAYAPDGRSLVTGGQDNLVRLWALADPHDPGRVIASHRGKVTLVSFAPDGRQVASAGYGEGIVVSRLDGTSRRLPGHHGRVRGLAWSPDGLRLASCSDLEGTVHIADVASGETQELGGAPARPFYLAFAADGRHLGVAGADGSVRLWDLVAATRPAALAAWLGTLTRATIDPGAPLASR
jgi:WD40 repeat protein